MDDTQSPQFKKLRDKWYKKLEHEGFEDLEREDGSLKTFVSAMGTFRYVQNGQLLGKHKNIIESTLLLNDAKLDYYSLAREFLNSFKFRFKRDKTIFELHSEGVSCRDISKVLISKNYKDTSKSAIDRTIQRLKKIMFSYTWRDKLQETK